MFNRTIYLPVYHVLCAATLSASSFPANSVVKMNVTAAYATCQYPREVSIVADYARSGSHVITKESLIRFGFAVYYYA